VRNHVRAQACQAANNKILKRDDSAWPVQRVCVVSQRFAKKTPITVGCTLLHSVNQRLPICPIFSRGISQMYNDDNSRSSIVSIIAFCGFCLLLALALPLCSPAVLTWLEAPTAWLALHSHPISKPTSEPAPTISTWSDTEIRAALMQCVQSVAGINADLAPIAPIREGECGSAAPIVLTGIDIVDKVTFDPPLLTNCPMVVALHRWLNEVVQPAARQAFGSPVSKIIGSSYACRTVYNEPNGHLSQHAFANAVDLPIFVLANGRKVDVAHGWGQTRRDLIAAAKTSAMGGAPKTASTDVVKISAFRPPKEGKQTAATANALDQDISAEAKFLRLAVHGACSMFSTVLGPEANDVHRTHFHLDLQDRGSVQVCQ